MKNFLYQSCLLLDEATSDNLYDYKKQLEKDPKKSKSLKDFYKDSIRNNVKNAKGNVLEKTLDVVLGIFVDTIFLGFSIPSIIANNKKYKKYINSGEKTFKIKQFIKMNIASIEEEYKNDNITSLEYIQKNFESLKKELNDYKDQTLADLVRHELEQSCDSMYVYYSIELDKYFINNFPNNISERAKRNLKSKEDKNKKNLEFIKKYCSENKISNFYNQEMNTCQKEIDNEIKFLKEILKEYKKQNKE